MSKKRLTLEEIKKYLIEWRKQNNQDALIILVNNYIGLINVIAQKYKGKGVSFDDLTSAGKEGLIKAINKVNYLEFVTETFPTYVGIWVEGQMKQELNKYNKHSHVISFEQPIGTNKNGDEMKVEDLIGTDSTEVINEAISEMQIDVVRNALNCLTSRERQIILLRYGLDEANRKTQEEVAEILNCTRYSIMKQEQKALTKMRHPRNTRKLKDFIED